MRLNELEKPMTIMHIRMTDKVGGEGKEESDEQKPGGKQASLPRHIPDCSLFISLLLPFSLTHRRHDS